MQWRNLCSSGMDFTIPTQISRLRFASLEMTVGKVAHKIQGCRTYLQ